MNYKRISELCVFISLTFSDLQEQIFNGLQLQKQELNKVNKDIMQMYLVTYLETRLSETYSNHSTNVY